MMPSVWRRPCCCSITWSSAALFVFALQLVQASASVTANPSNDSLPYGNRTFQLTNTQRSYPALIQLAPLTSALAALDTSHFNSFQLGGTLVHATPSDTASINTHDIALISCDPFAYSGYLNVTETLTSVISLTDGGPVAVVLYSSQSDHCIYIADDPTINYSAIFTILKPSASQIVLGQLTDYPTDTSNTIAGNMATTSSAAGFGSNSSDSSSSSSGLAVSSPTTAVAMIILYTITGIITALFLGIIITGAVRAHRHPERYGPRNIVGRPRQSRARGIARAMLETIPIVKFGDSDGNQVTAAKRDVEMASRNEEDGTTEASPIPSHDENDPAHPPADENQSRENAKEGEQKTRETVLADVESAPVNNQELTTTDAGNNVCPICTDEFVKGQDVRVLPCNHQFHPDCIDPWLINVSGTCPLCRIDLNPGAEEASPAADESAQDQRQDTAAEQTAEEPTSSNNTNRPVPPASAPHRGLTGYLSDIRRARNAPVEERIAALRRLRQTNEQQHSANTSTSEDATDESQGRRRLTMRLRDRFRIRTRQHEGPSQQSSS